MATHLPSPDDFRCPISLEIMSDPVILSSGHTFDRSSIQRWLDSGHRTCPITNLPLPDHPSLIPNHALRSLISNFTPHTPAISHLYPSNFEYLISTLTSKSSPWSSKLQALSNLIKLTKRDPSACRKLTESGTVSYILNFLSPYKNSDGFNPVVVQKALTLILNLSLDDDNKVGLVAEGAIPKLAALLRGDFDWSDYSDCRAITATVITSLAVVEVNKAVIGEDELVMGLLVGLVREGSVRERKEGLTALYTLCSTYERNRRRAVREGAVSAVVTAVEEVVGLVRGVEVLGMLGKCKEGRIEMVKSRRCIRLLIKAVINPGFSCNFSRYSGNSGKGVEYGLLGLYWVCYESERVREYVTKEGVEEECVRLAEDENEKVRRNARNLLRILRGEVVNEKLQYAYAS